MQTNYASKLLELKDSNLLSFDKTTKIPFVIHEFTVEEILSRTQNSVVKRYRHHSIKKAVVIKQIVIPHGLQDENQEKKFDYLKQEIEFLQKLRGSKNVVEFYGFCINQDHVYICLESMDISLKELYLLVHRLYGNFPQELMVKIIVKIVDALCECHEKSITHRDVKPNNILVNWSGDIKLCDFGVSRIIYETSAYTTAGTYPYMPPEYFTNERRYGKRVDVWSLGITLIEILHGKNIIPDSQKCRVPEIVNVMKNLNDIIENLPKIYSDELKEFIMQCLTINYENRPTLEGLKNFCLYKNENEDGSNSFKSVIITTILHNSRLLFDKQHIDNSDFIVQKAEQIRNMKIIDDIRKAFQNSNIDKTVFDSNIEILKNEKETLGQELDQTRLNFNKLESELQETKTKLQAQLDSTILEKSNLTKELDEIKANKNKIEQRLQQILDNTNKISHIEFEKNSLIQKSKEEIDQLRQREQPAQNDIVTLNEKLVRLQNVPPPSTDIADYLQQIDFLNSIIAQKQRDISHLKAQNDLLLLGPESEYDGPTKK